MNEITSKSVLREYMQKYEFFFKKNLGQNFLIDANISSRIVSSLEIEPDDIVLEVGPGAGALTQIVATQAKQICAVEIDPFAASILKDVMSECDNFSLTLKDVLKVDLSEVFKDYLVDGQRFKAISNLPYYITSPILMKLLTDDINFEKIVVTTQKEVAQRLAAKPGTKAYSSFTITVDYYCECEYLFDISKNSFFPSPEVDSAVLRLIKRDTPKVEVKNEEFFFKVLRTAFATRRKTLTNCLGNGMGIDKEKLKSVLMDMGLSESIRGEVLTIEQFAELSNILYN